MLKAKKFLVIGVLILALLSVSGCGGDKNKEDNGEKPIPVSVAEAKLEDISNSTVITGKVMAASEVMLVPKIGGKVTKVNVDIGARVKNGDILVQLDTAELNTQLKQAQAALELARGSSVQNDFRIQDAKNNLNRMENLYNEGAISKQQYELALLQYNLAANTPAQAQVQQAQANVDFIKTQIDNCIIRAPISGTVAARNVEVGELAGPDAPVLVIVDVDKVYVEGMVTENDISHVSTGQKVRVRIDAAGEQNVEGTIKALSPAADPRTKGYQVKVEIDNADGRIKPGMFAEIRITTQARQEAVVIPKEALISRGDKKVIFVIKENIAEERPVSIGLEDDQYIEITKGLAEGELVVTLGQHSLSNKARVLVKE